jgi:hypothetical protein
MSRRAIAARPPGQAQRDGVGPLSRPAAARSRTGRSWRGSPRHGGGGGWRSTVEIWVSRLSGSLLSCNSTCLVSSWRSVSSRDVPLRAPTWARSSTARYGRRASVSVRPGSRPVSAIAGTPVARNFGIPVCPLAWPPAPPGQGNDSSCAQRRFPAACSRFWGRRFRCRGAGPPERLRSP